MRLVDGINTQISWDETELSWTRDDAGNDVLLLLGNEPDHAWVTFADQVFDLAADLAARIVVGFGASPAPSPPTRPPLVAASASEPTLPGVLARTSAEVPTGILGPSAPHAVQPCMSALGRWVWGPL